MKQEELSSKLKEMLDKSKDYDTFIHNLNIHTNVIEMAKYILKQDYFSFKDYFNKNKESK